MINNNKMHLGVYGLILRDSKVLLIKKIRGPYTGKMDLPGGKIEHGESIYNCLKREISEETGIEILSAELLDNLTFNIKFKQQDECINMHHIGLIYKILNFDDSKIIECFQEKDSGGAIWNNLDNINFEALSPFANIIIKNYGIKEKQN